MALKVMRSIDLLLVALTLGMTFCHALEIYGKLKLSGAEWLAVQQHLYAAFGAVGGAIEVLAVLFTWIVLAMVWPRGSAKAFTLIAAICGTVALIIWLTTVSPMNTVFMRWVAATLRRLDSLSRSMGNSHAISASLYAVTFSALVISILAEIHNDGVIASRE